MLEDHVPVLLFLSQIKVKHPTKPCLRAVAFLPEVALAKLGAKGGEVGL